MMLLLYFKIQSKQTVQMTIKSEPVNHQRKTREYSNTIDALGTSEQSELRALNI